MTDSMRVFDRRLVARHRDRAAASLLTHDFLFREVAERLADRLGDFNRTFPCALDLGCHGGELAVTLGQRGGITHLIQSDLSAAMARRARQSSAALPRPTNTLVCDEEMLPFAPASFDLILSCLSLHWVNDLPGALAQMRVALKPDGLLLAAMLGGDTLIELRTALAEAEIARADGLSPRVSPFADSRDAGALLQRAGFALPVVDSDRLTVSYRNAFALMHELRGMGETNAVIERRRAGGVRAVLFEAAARYAAHHGDGAGRVPATFHVVYLTAWAPHAAQQKPLAPGQARTRLAEALGTSERPAGDTAAPK